MPHVASLPSNIVLELAYDKDLLMLESSSIGFTIPAANTPTVGFASSSMRLDEGDSGAWLINISPPAATPFTVAVR